MIIENLSYIGGNVSIIRVVEKKKKKKKATELEKYTRIKPTYDRSIKLTHNHEGQFNPVLNSIG